MSCWTAGANNRGAGAQAVHAPQQIGAVVASPGKCPVCGWFAPRSGACINEDCGTRQTDLQAVGAWPQPGTHGAQDWNAYTQMTRTSPSTSAWQAAGLSRRAYGYLRATGIPPQQALTALQKTKAQVWMYLPRCPACKAWVSPVKGFCNNVRCGKAKVKAQVAPTTTWSWPPRENSLRHVQRALEDTWGVAPQAHTGWHAQMHDLTGRVPGNVALRYKHAYLQEVRDLTRVGVQEGWLDPESPAYDADAQQALYQTIDGMLQQMTQEALCGLAVWDGRWEGVALLDRCGMRAFCNWLNPATDPTEQVTLTKDAADALQDAQHHSEQLSTMIVDGLTEALVDIGSMFGETTPALPPSRHDWSARDGVPLKLCEEIDIALEKRYPWLTGRVSRTHLNMPTIYNEAYMWMAKARSVGDQPLSKTQTARALATLRESYLYMGYGDLGDNLTDQELAAILDNGWSPAEFRQARRQQEKTQMNVRQASVDPGSARAAGEQLRRLAPHASRLLRKATDTRKWERRLWMSPLTIPQMTSEQMRQFAAGAGCGAVASFYTDEELGEWLATIERGEPHALRFQKIARNRNDRPFLDRVHAALRQQGLGAQQKVHWCSADLVCVGDGMGTSDLYRVNRAPSPPFNTIFEKIEKVDTQ